MTVHPRLSLNAASSYQQSLTADLALWRGLGIDHVGLLLPKIREFGLAESEIAILDGGLRVATLFGPGYGRLDDRAAFAEDRDRTVEAVEFAASIHAGSMYLFTGGAGELDWDEAADALSAKVAPAVARGRELDVPVLVEATNPLRVDISFVHCQRDAVDLARRAGTGIVLDLQSAWYERDLAALVRENVDLIGLVQVSDFRIGTTETGSRVVPGDGDIPLARLIRLVLDAGYPGPFDLEVFGPVIEAEGYGPAVRRSVQRASALLESALTSGAALADGGYSTP